MHVADRNACTALCEAISGCNAVTFNRTNLWCWVKNLPEHAGSTPAAESDAMYFCDVPEGVVPPLHNGTSCKAAYDS